MNFRTWLHGLGAAAIGAAATAGSAALAVPSAFNLTRAGIGNFLKLLGIPALVAVFAYLKQSPLPADDPADTETDAVTKAGPRKGAAKEKNV
jgi:hypothetical protein